ncbi:MAG: site-2 protease family protein [Candidatus Micrarchaeota archaeon]|nr:site-2 protease family protein [Candidatus Micrarchaeota archaeon]
MTQGAVSIGRVFGINIELHWLFILLMLYMLIIPPLFLLFLLLFVCVLIHELAHSLTAIRSGLKVSGIMLTPMGGLSSIDGIEKHPNLEFKVAFAGPMMSFLLAAIFGTLVVFAPFGAATHFLQELFFLNLILAVFNIIPAFPMDGGRVFRGYLLKTRSFADATALAIKVSKYCMAAIIAFTVAYAMLASQDLYTRGFYVVLTLIIVVYLYGGIRAEEYSVMLRERTKGLRISDVRYNRYVSVDSGRKLGDLYKLMQKKREHIVVTKIGGDYALVDLMRRPPKNAVYVRDMAVRIPKVGANESIMEAITKMQNADVGAVAVTKGGRLLGVATASMLQSLVSAHMLGSK